jgi:hypothetical protein
VGDALLRQDQIGDRYCTFNAAPDIIIIQDGQLDGILHN